MPLNPASATFDPSAPAFVPTFGQVAHNLILGINLVPVLVLTSSIFLSELTFLCMFREVRCQLSGSQQASLYLPLQQFLLPGVRGEAELRVGRGDPDLQRSPW